MTQPLSAAFNAAVQTIANKLSPCGYDIDDFPHRVAPSSLRQLNWHIETFGRILVSGENSDSTIYGDAEHNYAFRAWHDWCHWHLQAPFDGETADYPGERAVCELQKEHLHILGYGTKFDVLIDAEIIGQIEYAHRWGAFPVDQYAFTLGYLDARGLPLAQKISLAAHYNNAPKDHQNNAAQDYLRGFKIGREAQFGY